MSDFRLGDLIQAIDENKEAMNVQLTGSIEVVSYGGRDGFEVAGGDTLFLPSSDNHNTNLLEIEGAKKIMFSFHENNNINPEDISVVVEWSAVGTEEETSTARRRVYIEIIDITNGLRHSPLFRTYTIDPSHPALNTLGSFLSIGVQNNSSSTVNVRRPTIVRSC